jgi:thiamine-phosphate pyrophosphorylase
MMPRQSAPKSWLILDPIDENGLRVTLLRLPRGTGVLLLKPLSSRDARWLRHRALQRHLTIVAEGNATAVRVHNVRELRRALLMRVPLVLLSPIYSTVSHPDWRPIPRMRAATLARLGGRKLIALGGMNRKRYATVERLGFIGWAGISAFKT